MRTFIKNFKNFLNERTESNETLEINFDDLNEKEQIDVKKKIDMLLNLNFDETKNKKYFNNKVSFIPTPIEYKIFKSYPETLKFNDDDKVDGKVQQKQKFDIMLVPDEEALKTSPEMRLIFDIVYIPKQKPSPQKQQNVFVDKDEDDEYLNDVFIDDEIDKPVLKSTKKISKKRPKKYVDFDDDSNFNPEEADKYLNNLSTLDSLDDDD